MPTVPIALDEATENHEVVPSTPGTIRVHQMHLASVAGCTVNFHEGGATLSGRITLPSNLEQIFQPAASQQESWFQTTGDNPLLLNTTGQCHGAVIYSIGP